MVPGSVADTAETGDDRGLTQTIAMPHRIDDAVEAHAMHATAL